jgi:trimethylamine--corrinoid protein Co-methyltransferase
MPSSYSALNLDGCGVNMLDYKTGNKRAATLQDIADSARIFEEIDLGRVLWPPVSPCDAPKGARSIVSTGTAYLNTSKHIQDEVKSIKEVHYVIEMAKAILGSMEEVKKRKIYSVTYCTVAPLAHDGEMLEAVMELTKYEAPVLIYPMPACGSTGPASLYSNIATANAEALSSIVLFQLNNPGTPLIYGAALGVINMRNGIFLEGAPETALQLTAMGEMGKFYNLPTIIAGCLTDAKEPGMQSVLEKLLTTMPLVMAGIDVVQGIGLIESSMTMSLEHIVIDGEIGNLCKRMRDGVDVNQEKNYFEDINAVGQEGHFLKQKTTKAAIRSSEFFTPELCDRGSYDEWISLGSPDMFSNAHKKVEKILSSEIKNPMNVSTEKILKEIMDEAKAKLL